MTEPVFEEGHEYLSKDGRVSDQCVAGSTTFQPKGQGVEPSGRLVREKKPNAVTLAAMKSLEEGCGLTFGDIDALFEDLGI